MVIRRRNVSGRTVSVRCASSGMRVLLVNVPAAGLKEWKDGRRLIRYTALSFGFFLVDRSMNGYSHYLLFFEGGGGGGFVLYACSEKESR